MLEAGQTAPGFGLPDSDGAMVHLSEYRDDYNVVLYFYPRDDTPGCTIEANDFTRLQDSFAGSNTVVLGVSRDDIASHAAFRDKFGLTVRLLADSDGAVCDKYEVLGEPQEGGTRKLMRSTFVIDRNSVIRHALYGVKADGHAEQVLAMVRELD